MLSQIGHRWVIVLLEDVLLSAPVQTSKVQGIVAFAQKHDAGLIHLLARRFDPTIALAAPVTDEISELPAGIPYRAALNLGLWNRGLLLDLLHPGETAWEFERQGSLRTSALHQPFFCLSGSQIDDPPFKFVHGILKGEWTSEAARFCRQEGMVVDLKSKGHPILEISFFIENLCARALCAFSPCLQAQGNSGAIMAYV